MVLFVYYWAAQFLPGLGRSAVASRYPRQRRLPKAREPATACGAR